MQRRAATYLIVPPVTVLLAAAVGLRACSAIEQPVAHYESYAKAKAADAVGPGRWIPGWLPESAVDIHEQHAIDSNSRCIRFTLPNRDAQEFRRFLRPLENREVESVDASCRFDTVWWFDGLIQQHPYNDHALNAELFSVSAEHDGPAFVAIDRVSAYVFVWSP